MAVKHPSTNHHVPCINLWKIQPLYLCHLKSRLPQQGYIKIIYILSFPDFIPKTPTAYGKSLKNSNTLFHKFCFLCSCFFKYLAEWQTGYTDQTAPSGIEQCIFFQCLSLCIIWKKIPWLVLDSYIVKNILKVYKGDNSLFVCVEVLRPSQPNGVMSSVVSLPNHTFTGQALSSKRLTSIVHILSPETDNCPSWISGRERMTVENISWSISTKECCRPRRGSNPRPPGLQSDAHPTEPPGG